MYVRGMSVREIQALLAEHYDTEVSPDFISSVTDELMAEALSWQSRPLEAMYPVVFFDALPVKIRDDGVVDKAVFQADGQPRRAASLDRADRGSQVLAQGVQRTQDARLPGHPDRRGRRLEGIGRGDRRGLSEDDCPDLQRVSDPQQSRVRRLQGPQGIRRRIASENDEAAIKLLWLALRNVLVKTVRAAFDWKSAMNQFAVLFGERFMRARG